MYWIAVKRQFSAAHRLEGHPGKCSRLHGHTWYVEAVFGGEELGRDGILIDFEDAGKALEDVIADFDHSYLNDVEPFGEIPPTAENVARVVFERLKGEAGQRESWKAAELMMVTVWESHDTRAAFSDRPEITESVLRPAGQA